MKILITGVNGFIGQHLVTGLLKRGHVVIGLGRNKKCVVNNITKYYSGDVLDKTVIEKAIIDVECVIHLAALTAHRDIVDNKLITLETNFLGTKNVLDAFSKSDVSRRFIYPSTGKVYGKITHLPLTENHQTKPLNMLGKSKLMTEQLIDFFNDNRKEFIIFRIFNMYGMLQKENFLIPTILAQLNEKKTEITLGNIDTKRDYVYIDDLIRAFILAIERKDSKGVSIYNICTGNGYSASDIVNIIGKIKKENLKIKINPALLRDDEMKVEYGSYSLINKNMGWEPKIGIQEGLERLIIY